MIAAFAVAGLVLLAVASGLVLYRIFVGPSNLDRIVGTDILLIIVIAGIGLDAAWHRRDTSLPLLVILGLVSFVGPVAVARFLSHEDDPNGSEPASLSFPPPADPDSVRPGSDTFLTEDGRTGTSGFETPRTVGTDAEAQATEAETTQPGEEPQ